MDRAATVVCPIMVLGVVILCGTAQPSIQRNARRFMLAPARGKLIVSADVAFGSKATLSILSGYVRFTPESDRGSELPGSRQVPGADQ
jgi:hypothetical protein